MTQSFSPAWWLPGPHAMTLWPRFFRDRPELLRQVESWDTPDGDQVDVVRLAAPPHSPRVVLLHGLEGSTRSHYAGGVFAECLRRGWAADMLIFRTCNGRMNRARRSYHSGETTDLDLVIRRVRQEHPYSPLGLVGVSLGANVLLKWLGEQGNSVSPSIRSAAAISTPFDLARSSRHIDRGFSRMYQRHFLRSLRRKALEKIERFPNLASEDAVLKARTFWQFDDAYTSVVHGFRDAADYYAQSSSLGFLHAIRVPTLLLSSRDDPFLPRQVLADVERVALANPLLTTEFHARGGHAGFVEGSRPGRPRYYAESRIAEFLSTRWSEGTA